MGNVATGRLNVPRARMSTVRLVPCLHLAVYPSAPPEVGEEVWCGRCRVPREVRYWYSIRRGHHGVCSVQMLHGDITLQCTLHRGHDGIHHDEILNSKFEEGPVPEPAALRSGYSGNIAHA